MSRIKVLPVYPRFPLTFWSYRHAVEMAGKKAIMPPNGLATAMSMFPEEHFDVQRIVDMNAEPLTDEQIEDADMIATSTMIIQRDSHEDVVARAHALGKKIIAGGPFVTTYPERTGADYVVAGEAEVTLPVFLEDLLEGSSGKLWTEQNVAGRSNALLTRTGKADVTRTPLPKWDLLDLNDYASAAVQFSRGCPFNCDFCDITKLYGREPRTKTPGQMLREFDALYEKGHRGSVFVVDDNFIGNKPNVRKVLPALTKWQEKRDFPFCLFTEASMDLASDSNADILQGMYEAGFNFVFLGIESVDNDVLRGMQKGQNTRMSQLEAVRRIQQAGLEVSGGFIIGSDGETPEVFDNLFEFIQEAGIPTPMPGLLTAVRGTDLYNRLEREGRIRYESNGNNVYQLGFNFEPLLNEQFLVDGYRDLVHRLFDPVNYYQRCRTLERHLGPSRYRQKFQLGDLSTLGKSLTRQTFVEGGWEYLKYVVGTAVRNPSYLGEAVTQAVKFDHFRRIRGEMARADEYVPHTENLYHGFADEAERIFANTRMSVGERVRIIRTNAHDVLGKAERSLSRLHEDFRSGGAEEAFKSLRLGVNNLLNGYVDVNT